MKKGAPERQTKWRFVRIPRNLTDDWANDLTRHEWVCYMLIARRTNDSINETAVISSRDFVKTTQISARPVRRAILSLKAKNLILAEIIRRKPTVFSLSTERRTDFFTVSSIEGHSKPVIPTMTRNTLCPDNRTQSVSSYRGTHNTIEETSANGK